MSTHHSTDMTPSDSSEQLSAEEAEQQALARRVMGVAKKPMSTPKYVALLGALALVFGFGSWGIVRGVDRLENPPGQSVTTEDTIRFPNPNAEGIRHISVDLPKDTNRAQEVVVSFPEVVLRKNHVLHIHAPASDVNDNALCSLRLDPTYVDSAVADSEDYNLRFFRFCPSADDGSVDVWIPVARTTWNHENRPTTLTIKGIGATLNVDLMEFEDATPVDWDGTSPFQGTGPAFIRTTSGAYSFTFDADISGTFRATVHASQGLNYFGPRAIEVDPSDSSDYSEYLKSFDYSDGTPDPQPGYIFVLPSSGSMNVPWTLMQVDTGDIPVQ